MKTIHKIETSVRKWRVFSLDLYSEEILKELNVLTGFIIGGYNVNNISYADDSADNRRKNYRNAYSR